MPQKVHTNHGRDHRLGGIDEIPGIGAGGGLGVDWEDVGTVVPSFQVQSTGWQTGSPGQVVNSRIWTNLSFQTIDNTLITVGPDLTKVYVKQPGFYIIAGYLLANHPTGDSYEVQMICSNLTGSIVHSSGIGNAAFAAGAQVVHQRQVTASMGWLTLQVYNNSTTAKQFEAWFDLSRWG
jgi:hypothetical protein